MENSLTLISRLRAARKCPASWMRITKARTEMEPIGAVIPERAASGGMALSVVVVVVVVDLVVWNWDCFCAMLFLRLFVLVVTML